MSPNEKEYQPVLSEKLLENGEKVEEKRPANTWFLYISALSACLLSFGFTVTQVWTSPVIIKLKSNDSTINPLGVPITTFQEAMLGSLTLCGAIFGSVLLAKLCDIIGRLKTMILLGALQFSFMLLLAFSTEITWYYISRFSQGVCMSASVSTLAVFLMEISEDHNRGMIGSFIGMLFPLGNLYTYVLGPLFSVKVFTILCSLPYLLLMVLLVLFVPESPIYLASKGKRTEAIRALRKLRNKSDVQIEKEYQTILNTLASTTSKGGLGQFFQTKALRKALLIVVVCKMLLQLSGVTAITIFAGPLFDKAKTNLSGNTIAIMIGSVKFLAVCLATGTIEKLGKRPLLLISTFGAAISHFALGTFFYLQSNDSPYVEHILWLPIVAVLFYVIFYGLGMGAVFPTLPSEIFPSHIKSIGSSVGTFVLFVTGMTVSAIFPFFIRTIGPAWCLWGFAVSCALGFVFIYFVIPEFKGKSIVEILELLGR